MKSKKFRVAVAGETVDGRTIEPQWLKEATETFNPSTYGVRVNVEHLRGLSGDKPFGMVGDVVSLSLQEDTLDIGGKPEKRTCLYAEIQPNDRAKDLNKADQKVYTSIELVSNFAGSGKYGLIGVAVTDSPASIGTERLQFSKVFATIPTKPTEIDFKFDEDTPTPAQAEAVSAFSAMREFFQGLGGTKPTTATAPVAAPVATPLPAPAQDFAALQGLIGEGFAKMGAALEASSKRADERIDQVANDLKAFKTELQNAPATTYSARPPVSGGGNSAHLADF